MSRAVTLLCDNTDDPNWGCRATSLALFAMLRTNGHAVRSFPRAAATTRVVPLPSAPLPAKVVQGADRVARRSRSMLNRLGLDSLAVALDAVSDDFDRSVDRLTASVRSVPFVAELLAAVQECDAVVINGEGSMIFATPPRRDLLFQMTMARAAQRAGIPVHYVNALVSPCPRTGANQRTIDRCLPVLAECASVIVREPRSEAYLRELGYSEPNFSVVPDALFSWSAWAEARERPTTLPELEPFPERPETLAGRRPLPERFVVVSGASVPPTFGRDGWAERFDVLVGELERRTGHPVVLAVPDRGDEFLLGVGERTGAPTVRTETPMLGACRLLANAEAYVSGRYHPSIMASLGGTPLVHFDSNSHKLQGLAELLGDGGSTLPSVDQPDFVDAMVAATVDALAGAPARGARAEQVDDLGRATRGAYGALLDG